MNLQRPEMRVKSLVFQKMMDEFTLSSRMWTAYTPNKLEHIMRFYHLLPAGFLYSRFDTVSEELIFVGPVNYENESTPIAVCDAMRGIKGTRLLLVGHNAPPN